MPSKGLAHKPGFIVGGGPSLRGFDFEQLRGRRCMAINVAFKDVPWAEIVYVGDRRLFHELADDPEWLAFKGARYSRDKWVPEIKKKQKVKIHFLIRIQTKWSKRRSHIINAGNSGLSGLNLAELLGWNPVFLLGFDCDGYRDDGRMDNYHGRYPKDWAKSGTYLTKKFTMSFERVKGDIKTTVYNCNPKSTLECFPRITFNEAIEICRSLK